MTPMAFLRSLVFVTVWRCSKLDTERRGCSTVEHDLGTLRHRFLFDWFRLVFCIGAATQAKAFHLSIQPGPMVVEDLGGLLNVSSGPFERLRNRFTFDLFHREIRRNHAAELTGLR